MIKDYVYKNLRLYGNSLIPNSTYEKYGERLILNELRKNGYDCDLKVVESVETIWIEPRVSTKKVMKDIIVEVKR